MTEEGKRMAFHLVIFAAYLACVIFYVLIFVIPKGANNGPVYHKSIDGNNLVRLRALSRNPTLYPAGDSQGRLNHGKLRQN
ncbi:MAG: hypothetical protein EHM36_12105 [Deltaproteobacteria bacterium]|nr:MAG: hypothetical protein EHM36_12105 [Deltaproteobacteria bacterium]